MQDKVWAAWRHHSAQIRARYDLPKASASWTGRPGVSLRGVPDLPRVHDLLNACFSIQRVQMPQATTAELTKNLWVDYSQAVQRMPWSRGLRTACTSSMFYSFEQDVSTSGFDMMRLLGWPRKRVVGRDRDFRLLAGESYSLPWLTVLHGVLFTNPFGPWWKP